MQSTNAMTIRPERASAKSVRLHYLDWLRVLAVLGVFLFHAVHPFDYFDWEIKNAEQSVAVTLFIVFFGPWGMPFFFLMSGTGSWFSLRRRTGRQYASERVKRLLIPFIVGSLILSPIQLFFQWKHQSQRGVFEGSLLEFLQIREISFGPRVFGWAGYHLWFLGFLFAYSTIALPLFLWLKRDAGRRFISWLARLCERRGGLLLFIIPLALVQFILRPAYPGEHDWADFGYTLVFFLSGYILYADERFAPAIRRDWPIALTLGIASTLFFFAAGVADVVTEWMATPGTPGFYLSWSLFSVNSWCWTLFVLHIGMRFLDFRNQWLEYGQEAAMPFYLFHQPVIIVIAFFVVQWDTSTVLGVGAGILVKLLIVVLSSFVVTLGLYELLIRRINAARVLFGIKSGTKGSGAQSRARK
jgi:glucan biosynthesis protein C